MTGALGRIWIVAAGLAAGAAWRPPAAVGAAALLMLVRRRPVASLAGLAAAALALGAAAAGVRSPDAGVAAVAARAPTCVLEGVVREHLGGLGTLVGIRRADCYDRAVTGGAVVTPPLDAPAGAPLRAEGILVALDPGDAFDAQRLRLGADAAFASERVRAGRPTSPPLALAARIRSGLRAATASLEPAAGALVRGLTIGDVGDLPRHHAEELRRAGLSHLVAVSGSNVAIVLGALLAAARRCSLALRVGLAASGLVLFVLVVGPEPSVLRAAAMGAAGLAALVLGTRSPPLHVLGLAVVCVVALRPALVHAPGLHLSVAATAGIVLWAPGLAARLPLPAPAAAAAAVTLAAQASVTPVLVLTFGEVPVAGAVANLVAAPVVPPATILGFAAAALGALSPALAAGPARLAAPGAEWLLFVAERFGAPAWASVTLPAAAGWALAGALALAALWTLRRPPAIG